MTGQAELSFRMPAPAVSPDDVAMVVQALRGEMKWLTAEVIVAKLAGTCVDEDRFTDRKVRKAAGAAMPQIVSYPGSPGYKLFQNCTVEEINHCIESFESQARDMLKRAVLYRQAYHRRFRGQGADKAPEKGAFRVVLESSNPAKEDL